ncbi:alpha-catulin isoform X2 [Cimex lectularius]|uniref:Alpha-catulin n=1 Tax=Cimex lectularius TaxID=79782 RepID=A0A8I6SJK7_CIMLE|nr:alpha-catulin isoform X2 [Cimex lectularius]
MANSPSLLDDENITIKTKSIEKTILPLVQQISNLVSHRERSICSERSLRVIARVGQGVNVAVDRFVTVGESIASDIPELRDDMFRACNDARAAGSAIEKLCESAGEDCMRDRAAVARAAKSLLASVTRVLLLADVVVVKQLLLAKDKVIRSLGRLEGVSNFTEFVKAFSQFGQEMVELAHLTGDRQNDMKDERRRAQMMAARQVLERSTLLLLTSSKTCLRHPDSSACRENRDTVFCQMRRAMDLIHFVVKDGVFEGEITEDWDAGKTVLSAIRQFENLVEMTRLTYVTIQTKESLSSAIDTIIERTQDFTDSAYTSHEHRENILLLCDRVRIQLSTLLRVGVSLETEGYSPTEELECAIQNCLSASKDLHNQLICTTREQTLDLPNITKSGAQLVNFITNSALACDEIRTQHSSQCFSQHIEHIVEMCKLLRHIASTETLQVSARYTEINIRIYGPQIALAATTLTQHPTSKIAKENLEVFTDMWHSLMSDVTTICKDIMEAGQIPEKQMYMSLPRPGKHGTTSKPLKAVRLDVDEQEKIAKPGLEMKLASSEVDAETERWQDAPNGTIDENNDIVKRAKNMSRMAVSMYQFTKGSGSLKTTQDLFTQAEYFAEEANRLYKIVRQFSYQVPAGAHKKELLEQLDRVPTHVQQLQFTVKNPTVGKAATFTKVDTVIHETKNLMSVISKVVTTCFVCATKYTLDLQGVGWNGSGGGSGREEGGSRAGGDQSKGGSSSSSDPGM